MALGKSAHEGFAKFFESPTRHSLRELLQYGIGETDNVDFKESLPEKTKLAKHILAIANSGGGVLVIGVKDGSVIEAVGLETIIDKSDIQKQISPYLPDTIKYEVLDFIFNESEYTSIKGKKFQVIIIESEDKNLPYICKKSGDDIKVNVLYVRKGTNSTEASHEDFQKIISKRIDTGYSSTSVLSLEEHLEQLKLLYKQISPTITKTSVEFLNTSIGNIFASLAQLSNKVYESEPNPKFPSESYDDFIVKIIEMKKTRIKKAIEV